MNNKWKLVLGVALIWFIATEIQKIKILMKQEEKIQSIFDREHKFSNLIANNCFTIDSLRGEFWGFKEDVENSFELINRTKENKKITFFKNDRRRTKKTNWKRNKRKPRKTNESI